MDTTEKYISKGKDVHYKEIDSKSILLNLDSGTYYTLNRTGTFIWNLIDGEKRIGDIVGEVALKFNIGRNEASKDMNALISELVSEGLAELRDEPK